MRRAIFAGAAGAVSVVVGAFLVIAVVSAIWGAPQMYEPERKVYGWEGAQYGMMLFVLLLVIQLWPLLLLILLGAVVGVIVQQLRGYDAGKSANSLRT
jgi:hypothetical protein